MILGIPFAVIIRIAFVLFFVYIFVNKIADKLEYRYKNSNNDIDNNVN